ncbi:mycothiol-dependent nitroreductase Rv2466c family protein [Amycolatopsis aidingensis]|uniref:mycothiol-dependent nitroreductase Rv2466c family protein n=1 Tax=Amycolatopsis aidingensis TaxID=2842453 RepID=UPI001C0BB849|nr:DsbA family protein [Amycolatopsis aidingensis]
MTEPTEVDVHVDPMCPFAYQAARWLRAVRAQAPVTLNWRFFSLEEINRAEGKKHPWQREWSYGWSLMRIGALLRRQDMALLDAWYDAVGRALHERGEKPHERDTARSLLTGLGLDAGILDRAIADPSTHQDVYADHERVVAAGGFGVPTLFFADGQCLFGPVLVDPPTGPAALRLWQVVTGALEFPTCTSCSDPRPAVTTRSSPRRSNPICGAGTG